MVLRGLVVFLVLAALASFAFFWAHEDRLTWFDTRPVLAAAAKYDATIVRDRFGVPHISGRRDADAAFGLGYAHAEDDFATLQRVFLSSRGRLATVDGVRAAESDYLVQLMGIWDAIAQRYRTDLSAETRALLDGYSAGLNLYAAQHRSQVLPGFAPVRGEDVVALFMLRLPFLYGLDNQLRALIAGGTSVAAPIVAGAIALAGNGTTDLLDAGYIYGHASALHAIGGGYNAVAGNGSPEGCRIQSVFPGCRIAARSSGRSRRSSQPVIRA